jgi:hypothetical protein
MPGLRKVVDEKDARACLAAIARSGETLGRWTQRNGIDGRSLGAWRNNLAPRSPRRPRGEDWRAGAAGRAGAGHEDRLSRSGTARRGRRLRRLVGCCARVEPSRRPCACSSPSSRSTCAARSTRSPVPCAAWARPVRRPPVPVPQQAAAASRRRCGSTARAGASSRSGSRQAASSCRPFEATDAQVQIDGATLRVAARGDRLHRRAARLVPARTRRGSTATRAHDLVRACRRRRAAARERRAARAAGAARTTATRARPIAA